ncbi:MAG: sulfite exporter TauE/SafE family protein [Lentilitoribacter sp.]
MLEFILIIVSGFAAGLLNSVAGGGTFFTLPVLIMIGTHPTIANATATLSALPGYLSSAWAYRKDIQAEGVFSLQKILVISCIGGLLGAVLLTITSEEAFLWIIPFLLLIATVLFAMNPFIMRSIQKRNSEGLGPLMSGSAIFVVSVYGGYFNGGLGIMLLAMLGLIGFKNLHGMNGLKTILSAILSFVSAFVFIAAELIAWEYILPMAISNAFGGYIGAYYIRKVVRTEILKTFIVLVGLAMTITFFMHNFSHTLLDT